MKQLLNELNEAQEVINKELSKLDTLTKALSRALIMLNSEDKHKYIDDTYNLIDLIKERQEMIRNLAEKQEERLIKAKTR